MNYVHRNHEGTNYGSTNYSYTDYDNAGYEALAESLTSEEANTLLLEYCDLRDKPDRTDEEEARYRHLHYLLFTYHSPLAYQQANRVLQSVRNSGALDEEDVYQEALLALHRALQLYNADQNVAFSTYAVPTIKNSLQRVIKLGYVDMSVSFRFASLLRALHATIANLEQLWKRSPTVKELQEMFPGVSLHDIQTAFSNLRTKYLSERIPTNSDGDDPTLEGCIEHPSDVAEETTNSVYEESLLADIRSVVKNDRDFYIFCMRLGIGPYSRSYTFEEIAGTFDITRQRAHQVYNNTLRLIKQHLKWKLVDPELLE